MRQHQRKARSLLSMLLALTMLLTLTILPER